MRKLVFDAEDLSRMLSQDGGALRDKLGAYRTEGFEILLSVPAKLATKNVKAQNKSLDNLSDLVGLCDARRCFTDAQGRVHGVPYFSIVSPSLIPTSGNASQVKTKTAASL